MCDRDKFLEELEVGLKGRVMVMMIID